MIRNVFIYFIFFLKKMKRRKVCMQVKRIKEVWSTVLHPLTSFIMINIRMINDQVHH